MTGCSPRIGVALAMLALVPAARADLVELRGGGQLSGAILPDPARPESVVIQTAQAPKPLVIARDRVASIAPAKGLLHEFVSKKDAGPKTAQGRYDLGLWCEDVDLPGPAEAMYAEAAAIDPQFGPARKKLGHVLHGSRWMTPDERRAAQGLVKHKGRWISRAAKDKLDEAAALSAEQASWASRIKLLRAKLRGADPAAAAEAREQIAAIRDRAAIPGLVHAFASDEPDARVMLAKGIAAIDGPEATEALARLVVVEPDDDVRRAALDELGRRRDPDAAKHLIAALKARDPVAVGRAAWSLAAMRTTTAVPDLVNALIQSEKRLTVVPVAARSGGGGGMMSGSYGFAQGVSGGPGAPANMPPGFASVASYGVITGVAQAPGAVAYGVTGVPGPIGANPVALGGTTETRYMPVPAKVTVRYQNQGVLDALESLTGQNFGFDQRAWRRWVATSFRLDPDAPRRVPQP